MLKKQTLVKSFAKTVDSWHQRSTAIISLLDDASSAMREISSSSGLVLSGSCKLEGTKIQMGLGPLVSDRSLGQEMMKECDLIEGHGSMMEGDCLNGLVRDSINFEGVKKGEENAGDFRKKR